VSLFTALARTAADNARRSLDDLQRTVAERRTIAPVDHGPTGALTTLPVEECQLLLAEGCVGRFAYIARSGAPDVLPVNYLWHDGALLIRSGPGPKLQAAERKELVAFEIDHIDEETCTGWSVVVAGRAAKVAPEAVAALPLPEPWSNGTRRYVIRVEASRISGRRIL
jgi:nitroimidazol reductase NimA-like FMN-containing flavoprotein (pyridoxamine 5'-phosphate oxidase superfamily)